jgi:hypothetical protein
MELDVELYAKRLVIAAGEVVSPLSACTVMVALVSCGVTAVSSIVAVLFAGAMDVVDVVAFEDEGTAPLS